MASMTTLQICIFTLMLLFLLSCTHAMARNHLIDANAKNTEINVDEYGAVPDGKTDSTEAFQEAWNAACTGEYSSQKTTIVVPGEQYFLSPVTFYGPCTYGLPITIVISGTLLAPSTYIKNNKWIQFKSVEGLSIHGGTFNGRGQSLWKCKAQKGAGCPDGATSLSFSKSDNLKLHDVKLIDSERFHMSIHNSTYVTIKNVDIEAPWNSPNTDGIHLEFSSYVEIYHAGIATGDDCISLSHESKHIYMENIHCGPGHGVSIGSLGENPNLDEGEIYNITGNIMRFKKTTNGLRIKTWATKSKGTVKLVSFTNARMVYVKHPIIIQQDYCEEYTHGKKCPGKRSSRIAISQVSYTDVWGISRQQVGVMFMCSESTPCKGITLRDICLVYKNSNSGDAEAAKSECSNAYGSSSGIMYPPSCLK